MKTDLGDYSTRQAAFEPDMLRFLRTCESIQENLRLREVRPAQTRLLAETGDLFRRFNGEFAPLEPPETMREFHAKFVEAAAHLEKSFNLFMTEPSPNWTVAFLYSRRSFCNALYTLYGLRGSLWKLGDYFIGEGAPPPAEAVAGPGAPTGFTHKERDRDRSDYSLYVPENYTSDSRWPLIICMHGGYGEGYEYIWTWLRPARAKGYILLSPKSIGDTWSMTMGSRDTRSIMRMLDEVRGVYSVDPSRIYLTGLSDGGIMTYILGLERHEIFAGIAPVAGALHMAADPMLRSGTGRELPIFVIHGVHDFIFPVQFTRQTNNLLKQLGYNLTYEELPEWGHAFPYSINERLVAPWFEGLRRTE